MFIFTAKVTKDKLVIALLAAAAVIALLVVFTSGAKEEPTTETISTKVSDSGDMLDYIASYGWVVNETPVETTEAMIPEESSEVFDRYNEMQQAQGFDLTKYAGKKVKRVTYEVLNHPSGETGVMLTLITYKKEVVGGDVCSGKQGGFMHGLAMPNSTSETAAEVSPSPSPSAEPSPSPSPSAEPSPKAA